MKNKIEVNVCKELHTRINSDKRLYGAYSVEIIWSKNRKTIEEINYIDVTKVRNCDDNYFFISDDWNDLDKYPPIKYAKYRNESLIKSRWHQQILYVSVEDEREEKLNELLR